MWVCEYLPEPKKGGKTLDLYLGIDFFFSVAESAFECAQNVT